jgi:hypothetical protein
MVKNEHRMLLNWSLPNQENIIKTHFRVFQCKFTLAFEVEQGELSTGLQTQWHFLNIWLVMRIGCSRIGAILTEKRSFYHIYACFLANFCLYLTWSEAIEILACRTNDKNS